MVGDNTMLSRTVYSILPPTLDTHLVLEGRPESGQPG